MQTESESFLKAIALGLASLFLFIGIGLSIALFCRDIYFYDMKALDLVSWSGFSEQEIIENYNGLIDWCSPFVTTPFDLPSFPYSEDGAFHFEQCKIVFNAFLGLGAAGLVIYVPLIISCLRKRQGGVMKRAALISLVIPAALGIYGAIDFDRLFTKFHQIVFRNDLWLFDWNEDPIIRILPEEFFMHCAYVIIGAVILGSASLYIVGKLIKKQ